MRKFDYLNPKTLDEVFDLLKQYGQKAMLIAGGTDVIVMTKQKKIFPDILISLREISGLDQIRYDGNLALGPLVTHRQIEKSELIRKQFSALTDAADVLGSIQIRNVATIGGNICTAAPSADMAAPLLALGALLKLRSARSERTIPVDQFFTSPGETVLAHEEILAGIEIPKPLPNAGSAYWKHQRRQALDLPILGVAVFISLNKGTFTCPDLLCATSPISAVLHSLETEELRCEEIRIALGVAAPIPIRTKKAEDLLRGKMLSDELLEQVALAAADEAKPRDSLRGEAWYRRDMIKVSVKRMVMRCIERIVQPEEMVFPTRLW